MRRFFIAPDQIGRPFPRLENEEAHHIRTVLRLRVGTEIIVFDGLGTQFQARIVEVGRDYIALALGSRLAGGKGESPLRLIVAQGYLKEKKMDHLLPALSELGIARFIPMITRRSVAVANTRGGQARQERWQKIALQALKQCRRSRPMEIDPVRSFSEVLQLAVEAELKVLFWEDERNEVLSGLVSSAGPRSIIALVGPEGGLEETEVQAAVEQGFRRVGLGPRILRAETAALAASALLQFLFGDLGQNQLDIPKPV